MEPKPLTKNKIFLRKTIPKPIVPKERYVSWVPESDVAAAVEYPRIMIKEMNYCETEDEHNSCNCLAIITEIDKAFPCFAEEKR